MGRTKKKRTHVKDPAEDDPKISKSMVFKNGKVGKSVQHLVQDLRQLMLPFTAEKLQESKKNRLKDFLDVAGLLGVTHLISLSQSDVATNMRIIRCPRGPTLTFRVVSYSLMKDVVALQRRPHSPGAEFKSPPLVVLNNFGGKENHKQLMAVMFQNMFPPINMQTIKLSECRRVVLFTLDSESGEVDMRHYVINASPVGLTRSVKKIVKAKIPDLHRFNDISEFVLGANDGLSDSEVEDAPDARVTLPQDFVGRGNRKTQKSALRLQELGPRLRLKLLKIEEQVADGRVLYHAFESKTAEEVEQLQKEKERRLADKELRRQQQQANIDMKKKPARGARKAESGNADADDDDDGGDGSDGGSDEDDDERDDDLSSGDEADDDADAGDDDDDDQQDDDDGDDGASSEMADADSDEDDAQEDDDDDEEEDEEEQRSDKKRKVQGKGSAQTAAQPSRGAQAVAPKAQFKHKQPAASASSATAPKALVSKPQGSSSFKFVKPDRTKTKTKK